MNVACASVSRVQTAWPFRARPVRLRAAGSCCKPLERPVMKGAHVLAAVTMKEVSRAG